jgi:hypothetical protein
LKKVSKLENEKIGLEIVSKYMQEDKQCWYGNPRSWNAMKQKL